MITEQQRQERRRYIGSSDVGAILGIDPYRSAHDVWLDKTGRLEEWEGNEATERGEIFEPALVRWAEKKTGYSFKQNIMLIHPNGLMACNYDGIMEPAEYESLPGLTLECKTSRVDEEWGDEDTELLPPKHLAQVHHGLEVAGKDFRQSLVAVLLPELDLRLYRINRNDELCDVIREKCVEFMQKYVQADTPPDSIPTMDAIKRIKRVPNKTIELDEESAQLVLQWREAVDKASAAEKLADALKARVLSLLGDAERAIGSFGTINYQTVNRKGYEVAATTYRKATYKKAK